jgi:TonB family protein
MKYLLPFLFVLFSFNSFSQDTIFIDQNYYETTDISNAAYYVLKEKSATNPDAGYERRYFPSGQIKLEQYYSSFKERTLEGKRRMWRKDGSLWTENKYVEGKLHGHWISYWENGQLKRKDIYRNGKLKKKNVWDKDGNEVKWYPMEVRPEFPGGRIGLVNYLKRNTRKPEGAAGGRVVLKFVVEIDGEISNVRIIESTIPVLNLAAYNVVANMPRWEPAKQDGNPVRVNLTLPITFPN